MSYSIRASLALSSAALLALFTGCAGDTVTQSVFHDSPFVRPAPARSYAMVSGKKTAVPSIKMGDPSMVESIILEGQSNSQVMDNLTYLTKEIGPRLTGSRAQEDAARWAKEQFESYGLSKVSLFEWGTIATRFDRGPSTGTVFVEGAKDPAREMEFTTLAWIKGTDGPVRGAVVRMPSTADEFESVKESLAGAWVLVPTEYGANRSGIRRVGSQMRSRHIDRAEIRNRIANGEIDFETEPAPVEIVPEGMTRWTGTFMYGDSPVPISITMTDLAEGPIAGLMTIEGFHNGPIENGAYNADTGELTYGWPTPMGDSQYVMQVKDGSASGVANSSSGKTYKVSMKIATPEANAKPSLALLAKVLAAGPAGFLSSSRDERVWTTSKTGWRTSEVADYADDIEVSVRASDYDYINSRLTDGAKVEVEFDLQHTMVPGPIPVHNVIAEIPGSELPDQVVIMSGHLDSWNGPGSEGCIDNGTGSSVVLEAARILAATGARPKRTIRFILWTGEEQGLLGSRAYVESLSEKERAGISCVFVDDGGTNYQGGAGVTDQMVDYMAAASAPMNGRFFSPTDYDTAMNDENPENDANAGLMMVNITSVGKALAAGGGSDHASFNAVGIPGFFWNETGRANYRYGWHTQNDRLDLAIPEYLIQSATNSAVVMYNLACAPGLLPRSIVEPSEADHE